MPFLPDSFAENPGGQTVRQVGAGVPRRDGRSASDGDTAGDRPGRDAGSRGGARGALALAVGHSHVLWPFDVVVVQCLL